MKKITVDDLEALSIGSSILGSGGGGDPSTEKLMAQRSMETNGPVRLISIEELNTDDLVVPIAYLGSNLINQERLPSGKEFASIIEKIKLNYRSWHKNRNIILMPIEIGGVNSFVTLSIASKLNLSVLDADGMGRAFPRLQMTSFFLHQQHPYPIFLADCFGHCEIIESDSSQNNISLLEQKINQMGASAAAAVFLMNGQQAAQSSIPHSITLALNLGRTVLKAKKENKDPVLALKKFTQGKIIAQGVVEHIDFKVDHHSRKGSFFIQQEENQESFAGNETEIFFQNEFKLVKVNQQLIASTPDIITVLHSLSGKVIRSESLFYGLKASVLVFSAHELWKTPAGLNLVGPQAFNYAVDYKNYRDHHTTQSGGVKKKSKATTNKRKKDIGV